MTKPNLTPERLGEKLAKIRTSLHLSQSALLSHLALESNFERSLVSVWERGKGEPSIDATLRYAYAAGISVDILLDDDLNLPSSTWIRNYALHFRKDSLPSSKLWPQRLTSIREYLNLSQRDMIEILNVSFDRAYVSFWEKGRTGPPLIVISKYARIVGLSAHSLIDDSIKFVLPKHIKLNIKG